MGNARSIGPRAHAARFDRARGRIVIELTNGCIFAVPAHAVQGLRGATPAQLARIEILGAGYGLHWEDIDVDHSVPGLLMGAFGTRKWMAQELARRAGRATSARKAAAARRNGKKGGRPRKDRAA
jgi:hypothetical protein